MGRNIAKAFINEDLGHKRSNILETSARSSSVFESTKCCEHPIFRHDKVRGEIFCINCGMVIVERTIGKGGQITATWLGWARMRARW